jgi:Zn finger protein HypA/HybF involved in hydrogenase expression
LQKLNPATINGKSKKGASITVKLDLETMKLICSGPRNSEEFETWEEDVHCPKCHDKIVV